MPSIIRIADIPADELYLLPIIGLWQQIREDRNRSSSPDNASSERQTEDLIPGPAPHTAVATQEESPADIERFVTDWQLQDELHPSARFRFDRDGLNDGDHDEKGSDDLEDEDAGGREDSFRPKEDHIAGETFDVLYVDLGGEG